MKVYNTIEGVNEFYSVLYPQDDVYSKCNINKIRSLAIQPSIITVIWSRACYKKWDQGFFQDLINGENVYTSTQVLHVLDTEDQYNIVVDGAIVVHPLISTDTEEEKFCDYLKKFKSVMFVSTSDEEFLSKDHKAIETATIAWKQCFKANHYPKKTKFFTLGYAREFNKAVKMMYRKWESRQYLSGFAGQVQNGDRQSMFDHLSKTPRWTNYKTQSFGSGMNQKDYAAFLCNIKFAPCPQGNVMVETFRMAEALEAGCIPIVKKTSPIHQCDEYWLSIFGEQVPFPVINDWSIVPDMIQYYYEHPTELLKLANDSFAWWHKHKIDLTKQFMEDVRQIKNIAYGEEIILDMMNQKLKSDKFAPRPEDNITIIITTNNTVINPSIERIYQCLKIARSYSELRMAQAIVVYDGIPSIDVIKTKEKLNGPDTDTKAKEIRDKKEADYELYKQRCCAKMINRPSRVLMSTSLERICYLDKNELPSLQSFIFEKDFLQRNEEFYNTYLIFLKDHLHQANAIREALKRVTTKYVLMIEHDCMINGEINFRDIIRTMDENPETVKHVLFSLKYGTILDTGEQISYADQSEKPGQYLETNGIRLLKTYNWSMRPHIANTEYYRDLIEEFIDKNTRSYLEDIIYGIEKNRTDANPAVHSRFGTWVYYPEEGRMRNHVHHDCRGKETKVPMKVCYQGETPDGAPAPHDTLCCAPTCQEYRDDHGFQVPREKTFGECMYSLVEDVMTELLPKYSIELFNKEPTGDTVTTFKNQTKDIIDNLLNQELKDLNKKKR